jgi:signal transduction histidine kinase
MSKIEGTSSFDYYLKTMEIVMKLARIINGFFKYSISFPLNLLLVGWTLVIIEIVIFSNGALFKETVKLAQREAYKGYEKDLILSTWATMHGGVYVPVTNETQPDPYLSDMPERDIKTPSNKTLTLMNPAQIIKQVNDISFNRQGALGHIASLEPIRKENTPDKWEMEALNAFKNGAKGYSGFDTLDNEKHFRFMAPMVIEEKCLVCHAEQGFKVGDIRGGMSSSVNWENYESSISSQSTKNIIGYGILWLIGFIGISIVKKKFIVYIAQRDFDETETRKLNDELFYSKSIIEENLEEKNEFIEKITKVNAELKKINSEKDKLFSIIAHDLRSPFMGFVGLTGIFAEGVSEFSQEELTEMGKEMNKSANSLYKLLQNLLDWSLMQQGKIDFIPVQINLHDTVSQNIGILMQRGEQKGIAIVNETFNEHKVYADEAMLNSVFRNLLSNALKFTQRGGTVTICSEEAENGMLKISVADSGIGMPDSLLDKLFKMEEKTGRKGTDGEASTGLGLLLCKEFVEKNGGTIWAESEEGKGSKFCFTLLAAITQ